MSSAELHVTEPRVQPGTVTLPDGARPPGPLYWPVDQPVSRRLSEVLPRSGAEVVRRTALDATTSDAPSPTQPERSGIPRSSSASKVNVPPAGDERDRGDGDERLDRLVRFYATRPAGESGDTLPNPYLLFEAGELPRQRPSGMPFRRRLALEHAGFARLGPEAPLLPVAPRWSVVLDAPDETVRVMLDEQELFSVPESHVPEIWRQTAAQRGNCQVFAGIGLELEQDHPYLAIKHSLQVGECFGAVVLVDLLLG